MDVTERQRIRMTTECFSVIEISCSPLELQGLLLQVFVSDFGPAQGLPP